jgi:5-methylcytosine-specific restriction enzyme A
MRRGLEFFKKKRAFVLPAIWWIWGEPMSIRENLLEVLHGYVDARQEEFTGHALAQRVRTELPASIQAALPANSPLLLIKGSAGQGRWVRGPWAAIFNRLVTDSAQKGFYPVYLFAEDMSGVYLSLNQAMTEAKDRYRADAKTALRARAENFRAMLGPNIQPFTIDAIDLAPSNSNNDTAFYEASNICSVYYPVDDVPPETVLVSHLMQVLDLYQTLVEAGGADEQSEQEELETFYEGDGRVRIHLRVERNRKLTSKVKKLKGCRCEACQMKFSERYGELGAEFIEAHHLVPFSQLTGNAIPLDPIADFAVLCANCHRMAHRLDNPADIDGLRAILKANAA